MEPAAARTASGLANPQQNTQSAQPDWAESAVRTIDHSTQDSIGVSLIHLLTIGSIGASIALYLSGHKQAGIFIGLWPPTFQALKAAAERRG
jgi:hypothetical protein